MAPAEILKTIQEILNPSFSGCDIIDVLGELNNNSKYKLTLERINRVARKLKSPKYLRDKDHILSAQILLKQWSAESKKANRSDPVLCSRFMNDSKEVVYSEDPFVNSMVKIHDLFILYASEGMLDALEAFGGVVYIDATHCVTEIYNSKLITLMVQCPMSLRGIPVAMVVTNEESKETFKIMFNLLMERRPKWIPKVLMSDQAPAAGTAIQEVSGSDNIHVLHCLYHVCVNLKAVLGRAMTRDGLNRRDRNRITSDLTYLIYCRKKEQFERQLQQLKIYCKKCEMTNCLALFSGNFRGKQGTSMFHNTRNIEMWALYYRWEHGLFEEGPCNLYNVKIPLKTNIYTESYHNQIKNKELNYKNQGSNVRMDRLLNVLRQYSIRILGIIIRYAIKPKITPNHKYRKISTVLQANSNMYDYIYKTKGTYLYCYVILLYFIYFD